MGSPYLGEIRIVSFNYAPKGWALCNGQTLAISQNQALFALLGTYYGGNGVTTFNLPNLQASMPIHQGNGYQIGQNGGEANHTLVLGETPSHSHTAQGVAVNATSSVANGNGWAQGSQPLYATTPNTTLNPATLTNAGSGQPHNNMPPYLVLNFAIALQGLFPSQN